MRLLEGDGVRLEPQVAAHADELFALLSDPSLYMFTDDKEPASLDWLRARFARLESRRSPDGREHWLNWVVRNLSGEAVGYVQATVDQGGCAEIAYVLGKAFWRKGIATAAVRAMLPELASSYGATCATATLDPANTASAALLTRLGFEPFEENPAADEVRYRMVLRP